MSNCKLCNKEILPLEEVLYKGYCENCYESIYVPSENINNHSNRNNAIGTLIKCLSIISAIVCIIVFIIEMQNYTITGIECVLLIIASVVGSIFTYGFGEIIQLLEDIKNK